ncbi:MAG TPA: molecular chaperone HtpG [Aggregatilineales bacterium]|nr:molecular chaperone HtpG [Aggregatilineales bacterium]
MEQQTQAFEFRAEIQQLLNILVHSLYTDREIFLRELISNASDALHRLQFEMLTNHDVVEPDAELKIAITIDEGAKTITVSDTGIGMNRDELIENLGTIAHSGALSFLNALKEKGSPSADIIGQFGVGFYSAFMVADRITVTSRSYRQDDRAWLWSSDGTNAYTIEPGEKASRGTDVVLHIREEADEFLKPFRLEGIIRKHSNYIPFPIYVGDKVANAQTALWRRTPREVTKEDYLGFYKQLTFDTGEPQFYVHQVSDAPVQFYSLLYVPSKLDRGLFTENYEGGPRLYARKVLIQEHAKDLLPPWLRFVVGVVDSEDLPLNISRETVQANRVMARLKTALSGKLIGEMETMAEKEPDKYKTFWTEFGRMVKEGAATDASNRDRLAALLRFRTSSHPDEDVSLKDYLGRMVDDQNEIYYLFGEDAKSLARSPHLDIFKSRGIEVLFLHDPIDSFVVNALFEYQGKKLRNGAEDRLELPKGKEPETPEAEPLAEDQLNALVERIKHVLGDQVGDVRVSTVLTGSAARLVTPEGGFGADMERVYRMLDKEFTAPKRILELNPHHPLIHNLAVLDDDAMVDVVAQQLLDTALLQEGIHPNPADMVPRLQQLMEAATRKGPQNAGQG